MDIDIENLVTEYKTKDEGICKITYMADSHLDNAINYFGTKLHSYNEFNDGAMGFEGFEVSYYNTENIEIIYNSLCFEKLLRRFGRRAT